MGLAAFILGSPSLALPQGASSPPQASAKAGPASHVERRIKSLHDQLKITDAEEPQWTALAQVMRDNAQTVGGLAAERRQKAQSMNAVDDLRAYQAIAEAHAAGLAKLTSAFEALYAVMPPDQQKNADAVFAKMKRRPATRKKAN
jgi:hypothetical protein